MKVKNKRELYQFHLRAFSHLIITNNTANNVRSRVGGEEEETKKILQTNFISGIERYFFFLVSLRFSSVVCSLYLYVFTV